MGNEFLMDCAMKSTAILIAASGLCLGLRRAPAAARHLVWTIAFAALLLLPVLSKVAPGWTAPVGASTEIRVTPPHAVRPAAAPAGRKLAPKPAVEWAPPVWLLGAVLVLSRFLVGTARVWRKTRAARPMHVQGIDADVRALDRGPGAMPMTWGVLRPVVLLPSEAAEWPAERLRAVLLHELAHVERRDCLTLAMAELAVALYWFHPLAWWAASRMRRERERACDDRVLAAGVAASG